MIELKGELKEKSVYANKDENYCHVDSDGEDYLNAMVESDRLSEVLQQIKTRETKPRDDYPTPPGPV